MKRIAALFFSLFAAFLLCACSTLLDLIPETEEPVSAPETAVETADPVPEPEQSETSVEPEQTEEPETPVEPEEPESPVYPDLPEEPDWENWDWGDDWGDDSDTAAPPSGIAESGSYTTKADVALYLHTYGHLPGNFITKSEARSLGWEGGSLEPYAPGKCIGGDRFGNYEGLLPAGHNYKECDIDTLGAKSRGAKRIIFSDDGLIYYTGDHYASFEQLY